MATPYEIVYGRFLNSTTDFNLAELDDHTLNVMLKEWLYSAIVKSRVSTDLTRDEETETFVEDLTDLDIELLAMGMRLSWLDQTLNSTELTMQFIGGKEEKYYSQANHINELRSLRADTQREMQQLYTYSTYNKNPYFEE
jgi:hypothetical protein